MTIRKDAEVIGLVSVAHGTSHFYHLILAPLFPWLKVEFGLSYAELGLLMTVFFIISTLVQAAAGFWVDHSGPLKVLFFGVGCLAVSALILATAPSYGVLLLGASVAGLGNGIFHPADYTLINRRVSSHMIPHAYSMHGVSGSLGWAASPALLVSVTSVTNWRTALFVAAGVASCIFLLLLIRRKTLMGTEAQREQEAHMKKNTSALSVDFLRLRAVWLCWGFFWFSALALSGVQSFTATAFHQIYGMDLSITTAAYSTYMLASAAGMFVGGFVAVNYKHHERVIAIAFVLASGIALLIASGWLVAGSILTLFTIMGFCVGMAGPSRDLMIRAATPKEASGRVFGIVYSGLDSGLAAGPLLFGYLMDWQLPQGVFVMIAVFLLCALLIATRVGNTIRQQ